ncbi:MAG: hypothetical protein V4480_03485 [Patescibacteria group bacterium]
MKLVYGHSEPSFKRRIAVKGALKFTTLIHKNVSDEKRAMPHFELLLTFASRMYCAYLVPRPWTGESPPTHMEEFLHTGFVWFENVQHGFSKAVRVATFIVDSHDSSVNAQIAFYGTGKGGPNHRIVFGFHPDDGSFGGGYCGTNPPGGFEGIERLG